jgi:methionine sulfoxide reductase catalytic subunit
MLIKKPSDIPYSEVTPKSLYMNRRKFLAGAAATAGAVTLAARPMASWLEAKPVFASGMKLEGAVKSPYSTSEKMTPYKDVTNYNNYYEFSTDKYAPARLAQNFKTRPWTVSVEGNVTKPQKFGVDEVMKMATLEERIYRHRCVEGWSIVVPWIGFPLSVLINRVQPTSKANFVQFVSDLDPTQMPGLDEGGLDWPYTEGLRINEAMHPLAILCFGLYGEVLPNQNGAPIRVNIPWKYGFKSAKAIVKIRFVEKQPDTAWNKATPNEYGFYSNVNPEVDHPRWSQATERRLGDFLKRKTLMFNGYGDQVASLYTGMDLRKNF